MNVMAKTVQIVHVGINEGSYSHEVYVYGVSEKIEYKRCPN